jgi:hypothetical protein
MKYEQEFMEEVLSDNLDNCYQDDIQSDMFNNMMYDYL